MLKRLSIRICLLATCLAVIGFGVWVFAFGSSGIEWVDEQGKGNGHCHSILDAKGMCIMQFRLSNYSNAKDVYKLSIWEYGNGGGEVEVLIVKYGVRGDALFRNVWKLQLCDLNEGIELPSSCTPKHEMERLEIKVRYLEEGDTMQKTKSWLSVLLRARKFFYFPCV